MSPAALKEFMKDGIVLVVLYIYIANEKFLQLYSVYTYHYKLCSLVACMWMSIIPTSFKFVSVGKIV